MNFMSSGFELCYKTDSFCLLHPVFVYVGPPSLPLPWAHYSQPHWHQMPKVSWVRRRIVWCQHMGRWGGRTGLQASLSYKMKACLKNKPQRAYTTRRSTQTVVLATIKPHSDGCYHSCHSTLMSLKYISKNTECGLAHITVAMFSLSN